MVRRRKMADRSRATRSYFKIALTKQILDIQYKLQMPSGSPSREGNSIEKSSEKFSDGFSYDGKLRDIEKADFINKPACIYKPYLRSNDYRFFTPLLYPDLRNTD